MANTVISPKISTGISGLDELFYGGLRLPDPNGNKGICIVIYGNRGISKQDIAMQMMYGTSGEKHSLCRYYDINREASDMQSRYQGLHIGREIKKIRQSNDKEEVNCILCRLFDLNEKIEIHDDKKNSCTHFVIKEIGTEWTSPMYVKCSERKHNYKNTRCDLCKLIRHEVINYNDRTHALHWTIGESSNESNVFAKEKDSSREGKDFSNVFSTEKTKHLSPIQKYNSIFQKIKKLYDGGDKIETIVIGGFTAIGDELYDLSYNYLIDELRKRAKVSILVFDERGKDLHLNADILIEMRVREDEQTHYIHHELRVAKSDLQRHVYGWHHYKKLRDLSIEVFPNVHTIMSQRFASTHALLRLERDSLEYPQTLLQLFQNGMGALEENVDNYPHIINKLNDSKNDVPAQISRTKIELDYWSVAQPIKDALQNGADVLALLFGKQAIYFRQSIIASFEDKQYGDALSRVHSWEIRPGDIQPTEILFAIKQYLSGWSKKHGKDNKLYIYMDDLAQLGLYPMVDKEELFLPAMLSLCDDTCHERDCYKKNVSEKATIVLHVVCSDRTCPQFRYAIELQKWSNNLKLMKK